MTIKVEDTRGLIKLCFRQLGVSEEAAKATTDVLVLTEMMGITTHGLSRVATYCDRITSGRIDPYAVAKVHAPTIALRHMDGCGGLCPLIAMRALEAGRDAARRAGVGAVFVRGGTHVGALAPYLWYAT
ncbi:Ldh family oxidoreductase [Octadecabacter antarcticus]|uniref:Ldh family oxidoreductase n=1 Tax=Octadecabacter antarcticus TaxID=1217908 RepID=UPI000686E601|nr:Ldh family oxidoreductase [Octadecabacter antarcticus]